VIGIGMQLRAGPGGGAAGLFTQARDFDGTNDYALRGAALTGIAAGKAGIVSAWVRFDGSDAATHFVITDGAALAGSRISLRKTTGNFIAVVGLNAAGATILQLSSTPTYTAGAAWLHILSSWDLATGVGHLYVNDVDVRNVPGTILTNDTLAYATNGNFAVGGGTGGLSLLNGALSQLLFHPSYLDITVEANRRKFRSASGQPVWLGANGALPLGVQPLLYLPDGNPASNAGSGGNFTITGALDTVSPGPGN
jgi:hypothetical protein